MFRDEACIGRVEWTLLGQHNVLNGLAAIAASVQAGVAASAAVQALSAFQGVKRRMEVRGVVNGITVYDDFAHHPTAVQETLAALRGRHPNGKVFAVFEPRSATACRRSLSSSLNSILPPRRRNARQAPSLPASWRRIWPHGPAIACGK